MFLKIKDVLVDVDKYRRIWVEDAYSALDGKWSKIVGDDETIVFIKSDEVQKEFEKISDALAFRYRTELLKNQIMELI